MTLADRLRRALADSAGAIPDLLPGDDAELFAPEGPLAPAAVLVPVVDRAEPAVILTRRTETLRKHAGQVAFPGGRLDPDDDGPIAAALREAEEEIALPRSAVDIVGEADAYVTVTGYHVTPVIGVVPPGLALTPSALEVAALFEVPLAFLLDPANHRRVAADFRGRRRHYYEMHWGEQRIWGATAAMIVNLSRRLAWAA